MFRHDPRSGEVEPVTDLPIEPNGLAFLPDESLLYVSDTSAALGREATGNHCIFIFDVRGSGLANGRKFADVSPGVPDGFRVDCNGWIYTSSQDSVQVYHPDGTLLGKIHVPEKVGNVTFGRRERNPDHAGCSSSSLIIITALPRSIARISSSAKTGASLSRQRGDARRAADGSHALDCSGRQNVVDNR